MPRLTLLILWLGLGLLALGGSAWAQDRDIQPLLDRLGRLERDVNMLQRQVYQGAYQSGGVPATVPPEGQSALSNELQISQIQDQLRTLNGQIEELNYNLAQLKSRIDKMENDVEQRFSQLEHGAAPAGAGAARPPLAAAAPP
ncbi:MAG TPA: YbgF trimerization domain-containing protein, partial [Stellaceae bacterium]|nr:YbgF trimerization domain-containing protein [Stellaceae bacterium]